MAVCWIRESGIQFIFKPGLCKTCSKSTSSSQLHHFSVQGSCARNKASVMSYFCSVVARRAVRFTKSSGASKSAQQVIPRQFTTTILEDRERAEEARYIRNMEKEAAIKAKSDAKEKRVDAPQDKKKKASPANGQHLCMLLKLDI